MTPHAGDSGKGPAGDPPGAAGDPRRVVRTAGGEALDPAEPYVASQVSRLPARLGTKRAVDGFAVWRAYAAVRAIWRRVRRAR